MAGALALCAAPRAAAEQRLPGGTVYVGVSPQALLVPNAPSAQGTKMVGGWGGSLEIFVERGRGLAIISMGGAESGGLEMAFAGLKGGYVLSDDDHAPYLAAGLGWLDHGRTIISLTGGLDSDTGLAMLGEFGWLFHRSNRWGQVAISVTAVIPAFEYKGVVIPWLALSLKLTI